MMNNWNGVIRSPEWNFDTKSDADYKTFANLEEYLYGNFEAVVYDLIKDEPKIVEFLEQQNWEEVRQWDLSAQMKQILIDHEHIEEVA